MVELISFQYPHVCDTGYTATLTLMSIIMDLAVFVAVFIDLHRFMSLGSISVWYCSAIYL